RRQLPSIVRQSRQLAVLHEAASENRVLEEALAAANQKLMALGEVEADIQAVLAALAALYCTYVCCPFCARWSPPEIWLQVYDASIAALPDHIQLLKSGYSFILATRAWPAAIVLEARVFGGASLQDLQDYQRVTNLSKKARRRLVIGSALRRYRDGYPALRASSLKEIKAKRAWAFLLFQTMFCQAAVKRDG
ncbi:unnamed protein product, partial [Cladocopium goreaui]